jgi:excinuclease UvrABC nuclease subunit
MCQVVFEEWKLVDFSNRGWGWDHYYPGVYIIVDTKYTPLYVGSAIHVPQRVHNHQIRRKLKSENKNYFVYTLQSEQRIALEQILIGVLNPKYNIQGRTNLVRSVWRRKAKAIV